MANVLLGVTGSVASIYTPELFGDLRQAGHEVKIVATKGSLYFFDPAVIATDDSPLPPGEGSEVKVDGRNRNVVILDEDEWPGNRYQRGDSVLHIELRRWANVLLIAPCDANTLGKLALGICDNCLTCVYRAWDRSNPVIFAPAMNTLMWEHPATQRHLEQITADLRGAFSVIMPIEKKLACDDVGMGAMAEREAIVAAVASLQH